jgi:hypothetical protein
MDKVCPICHFGFTTRQSKRIFCSKKCWIVYFTNHHPMKNRIVSEETRLKMRASAKIRVMPPKSEETKKKLSVAHTGKIQKEETKEKLRNLYLGKTYEEIHGVEKAKEIKIKSRLSHLGEKNHFFGKKHTEETKKTIGWKKSPEFSEENKINLKKMQDANVGKRQSEETVKKRVEKNRGKKRTDELKNRMSEMFSGEKGSNWMGGKSFEPYTIDFNDRFKKSVKKRDGCCLLCNVSFNDLKLLKRNICIHHINYDKLLSVKENCVSLCNNCHTLTNHNRDKWIVFFQNLLSEKYDYSYKNKRIVLTLNDGDWNGS